MKHLRTCLLLCLALVGTQAPALRAQKVVLDLESTVQLAKDSSLLGGQFRSRHLVSHYQFLAWQASRKPQLSLAATPLSFERYITQRYLSAENVDVYRQQSIFYSQASLSATQDIEPLGGHLYGSSQLAYLYATGNENQSQYITVPIAFGYRQELLFFNPLKWARQIEPLRMTLADKQLAYDLEAIAEEAVTQFFALALAQEQLRMCEEYQLSCDTVYAIAQRRFAIASISKAELSILELEKTNARSALAAARIARNRAARQLAAYLRLQPSADIEIAIPSGAVESLLVDADEALRLARDNNPRYLASQLATTEARRDAARSRVEKNLSASIDASIGLNQVSDRFVDAYLHPQGQDMAVVTLSIPLVDWGKRKNNYLATLSTLEASEKSEQQTASDIELDVSATVADFNERQAIVETARQALAIAEEAYAQTLQQFITGHADTYSLTLAQSRWQSARQNQIVSLQNYYLAYYHLRLITLYDYRHHQPLSR